MGTSGHLLTFVPRNSMTDIMWYLSHAEEPGESGTSHTWFNQEYPLALQEVLLNKSSTVSVVYDGISKIPTNNWTHYGLVTLYGDIDLCQHWFWQLLVDLLHWLWMTGDILFIQGMADTQIRPIKEGSEHLD